MKGDYYKMVRSAGADLAAWLSDANRGAWATFTRETFLKYGFGDKKMRAILREISPKFYIADDGTLGVRE